VLIDAKFGHGKSIFNDFDGDFLDYDIDELIHNNQRMKSVLDQANRQVESIRGSDIKIQWKISTELGQKGIQRLFDNYGINIEVIFESVNN
jgi:hypothetical protein